MATAGRHTAALLLGVALCLAPSRSSEAPEAFFPPCGEVEIGAVSQDHPDLNTFLFLSSVSIFVEELVTASELASCADREEPSLQRARYLLEATSELGRGIDELRVREDWEDAATLVRFTIVLNQQLAGSTLYEMVQQSGVDGERRSIQELRDIRAHVPLRNYRMPPLYDPTLPFTDDAGSGYFLGFLTLPW